MLAFQNVHIAMAYDWYVKSCLGTLGLSITDQVALLQEKEVHKGSLPPKK